MGYYSSWTGYLQIVPPVYNVIDFEVQTKSKVDGYGVPVINTETKAVTIDGTHFNADVKLLNGIDYDVSEGKAYNLQDEVEIYVNWIANNTDSKVNGTVSVYGESSTDIWRLVVDDNLVVREEAEVKWPDGTTVDSNY